MKIALFGGTFDPIHEGHLHMAREFARRLSLDRVILMPTFVPPHKLRADMAPSEDRLSMCRLAAAGDPLFEVSNLEISRGGASFTADTLAELKREAPGAEWYLLTGADMFLTLGTWNRFNDIARMAVLCAAPRDGVTAGQLREYAAVLSARGARCAVEDIPELEASSTELRRRIREGQSLTGLVPAAIAQYIAAHHLYAEEHKNTMDDLDAQFIKIIRGRLSPRRFRHSLAVADQAKHLAPIYGADPEKAYTAGILHDIMKDTPPSAQLQILRDFGIMLDSAEEASQGCWHARTGAVFIERVLHVDDPDIINAVRYHTTARAGMSPLEMTVYLADFTSADRDYPDVDKMRRLAEIGSAPAMEYALSYTIRDLVNKAAVIHPDAVYAYNERIAAKLKGDKKYAEQKSEQPAASGESGGEGRR